MIFTRTRKKHKLNPVYLPEQQISEIIKSRPVELKEISINIEHLKKISKVMRWLYVNNELKDTDPIIFQLCFANKINPEKLKGLNIDPEVLSLFENFLISKPFTPEQIELIKNKLLKHLFYTSADKLADFYIKQLSGILYAERKCIKKDFKEATYYIRDPEKLHYFLKAQIIKILETLNHQRKNVSNLDLLAPNIKKAIEDINYIYLFDVFRNSAETSSIIEGTIRDIFALDLENKYPIVYSHYLYTDGPVLKNINDQNMFGHLLNIFYYELDKSVSKEAADNSYVCIEYMINKIKK